MVSFIVQLRKVIWLFWQLLARGCERHKSWLKQDGLEMRWEDLVLSFMSLHNARIKVQIFYGETRSSTKVKCPRTRRRYICSVLLCPWMWTGIWTESGHPTSSINVFWNLTLAKEERVSLNAWDKCLFLLKLNQSLFLCISDSMRFVLFGFENIFIFCVAILLNSVGEKIVLCALLSENLLV